MTFRIAVTGDLDSCLELRFEVFVGEQGVPVEEERDALDDSAVHVLATQDGSPVGTARILFDGATAKIGRVCVVKSARGTGLGARLIEACVAEAQGREGVSKVKLGAQLHALGFYEKLGFEAYGPIYPDAGIDHRDMVKSLV